MEDDTLFDKVSLPYTDIAPKGGETPFLLVLLLLIFFPPAAWYVMWKEEGFDHWLGYLIGIYGVLALLGSFVATMVLVPQVNSFYRASHLQQPAVSPLSYLTVYYAIGIGEIAFSILLYLVHAKYKKLPKNWLIIGVIGLAISSLVPYTLVFSSYQALNNLLQQTRPVISHASTLITPSQTERVISPTIGVTPGALMVKAKELLATKLGVSQSSITEISTMKKEWNDGSLGCPKPGIMYTQVVIEGYQIILQVKDKQYDFHAGNSPESVFLCEK
jgi:hypothetical protein